VTGNSSRFANPMVATCSERVYLNEPNGRRCAECGRVRLRTQIHRVFWIRIRVWQQNWYYLWYYRYTRTLLGIWTDADPIPWLVFSDKILNFETMSNFDFVSAIGLDHIMPMFKFNIGLTRFPHIQVQFRKLMVVGVLTPECRLPRRAAG